MRVTLRTRGLAPSGAISSHVERRLRFAAGRFESRLESVRVRLADTNGPRGGEDKSCRLRARVAGAGEVVVEDADADLYVAIDRAAVRFGRAVARAVERSREPAAAGSRPFSFAAWRDPALGME
ncbi:MAG: HPF/RaiA family ribosome-associated protein [Vicinamibacteria bacterium]